MIIDQWYTSYVDKVNKEIIINESDSGNYDIYINDFKMASVPDKEVAEILVNKIIQFNERYRREIDTFDICKELEIISKNKNATELGSYFS